MGASGTLRVGRLGDTASGSRDHGQTSGPVRARQRGYWDMPQSLTQLYVRLVFSTKDRAPFLADADVRDRVHACLAGACKSQRSPAAHIGGTEDHLHALCRLAKTLTVADLLCELKRELSKWVKATWPQLAEFYWQSGYGAFSISSGHVEGVERYLEGQTEHHRRETFQDELRRICRSYGVSLPPQRGGTTQRSESEAPPCTGADLVPNPYPNGVTPLARSTNRSWESAKPQECPGSHLALAAH